MKQIICVMLLFFIILLETVMAKNPVDNNTTVLQKQESLDTIVVVASKRKENVQDVPSSITVLSDFRLQDSNIDTIADLHQSIPNFTSYDFGGGFAYNSVRGISNTLSSSNALGIYIDDVPVMSTQSYNFADLVDVHRIEVLRGPQGTFYGHNTPGGVINIVTKAPDGQFRGKITGGFSNYKIQEAALYLDTPIVKDLLFASIDYKDKRNKEGFYTGESGQEFAKNEKKYFRGVLRYLPSEKLDIRLNLVANSNDGFVHLWSPLDEDLFSFPAKDEGENDISQNSQALRIKYTGESLDLVSVTSMGKTNFNSLSDMDFSGRGLMKQSTVDDLDVLAQEIRLISPDNDPSPFRWILGTFYSDTKNDNTFASTTDMAMFSPTPQGTMLIHGDYHAHMDSKTYAVFGQASYNFSERFACDLGLRYEKSEKSIEARYATNLDFSTGKPSSYDYKGTRKWDVWTPKVNLMYKPTDSNMFYATVAKGYKAGGFVGYGAKNIEAATYNPEATVSGEIGSKNILLGKKLTVNASAFFTKLDEMQLIVYNPVTLSPEPSNVGKATIKGVELEFSGSPMEDIEISAAIGLLDTEIEDEPRISSSGQFIDYNGKKAPLSPDYTCNIYIQYRPEHGFYAKAEGIFTGDAFFDEENTYKQPAYFLANAQVGYQTENFDLCLYLTNAFDKKYINYAASYGMIPEKAIAIPGDPRTFGIKASFKF